MPSSIYEFRRLLIEAGLGDGYNIVLDVTNLASMSALNVAVFLKTFAGVTQYDDEPRAERQRKR